MPFSRNFLPYIFGNSVQIQILDTLCKFSLKDLQNNSYKWLNLSQLAKESKVAKSSVKRVVDTLLTKDIIEEKKIQTHAQNPPREVRLNQSSPIVKELLFFFQKIRGFI